MWSRPGCRPPFGEGAAPAPALLATGLRTLTASSWLSGWLVQYELPSRGWDQNPPEQLRKVWMLCLHPRPPTSEFLGVEPTVGIF